MADLIATAVKRLTGGDKPGTPLHQLHAIASRVRADVKIAATRHVGRPLARVMARVTGRDPKRIMTDRELIQQRADRGRARSRVPQVERSPSRGSARGALRPRRNSTRSSSRRNSR